MIQTLKKIGIICAVMPFNCHAQTHKSPWQFSDDFVKNNVETSTKNNDPQDACPSWLNNPDVTTIELFQECQSKQVSYPWLTTENAHKLINIATLVYVCTKIYNRYHEIYSLPITQNSSEMMGTLKKILASMCPQFMQTIGSHGSFLIDSLEIAIKGLIYKTVAQLIVLCSTSNIVDFIGYGLQKTTHLVI